MECTTHHMGSMNSNLRRILNQKYPSSKDAKILCKATQMFVDCLENIPECHENKQVKDIIEQVEISSENCKDLKSYGINNYAGPHRGKNKDSKWVTNHKHNKSGNNVQSESIDEDSVASESISASVLISSFVVCV